MLTIVAASLQVHLTSAALTFPKPDWPGPALILQSPRRLPITVPNVALAEPVAEPVVEPIAEPVAVPIAEPAVRPVVVPVAKLAAELAIALEPVTASIVAMHTGSSSLG